MKYIVASILSSVFASLLYLILYHFLFTKLLKEKYSEWSKRAKELLKKGKKLSEKEKDEISMLQIKMLYSNLAINLIASLPLFAFYYLIKDYFKYSKPFIILPFSLPIIGRDIGWFFTYLLFYSIFVSLFKKVLKLSVKLN